MGGGEGHTAMRCVRMLVIMCVLVGASSVSVCHMLIPHGSMCMGIVRSSVLSAAFACQRSGVKSAVMIEPCAIVDDSHAP